MRIQPVINVCCVLFGLGIVIMGEPPPGSAEDHTVSAPALKVKKLPASQAGPSPSGTMASPTSGPGKALPSVLPAGRTPSESVSSQPLVIEKIFLRRGRIHVAIRHAGADPLEAGVYAATRLKLETPDRTLAREWLLPQVDPQNNLVRPGKTIEFDTGIEIFQLMQIHAALYSGHWKTDGQAVLSPLKSVDGMPSGPVAAPSQGAAVSKGKPMQRSVADLKPGTKALPRATKRVSVGSSTPPEGKLKSSAWDLYGIVVRRPLRGSIYAPGDDMQVVLTDNRECEDCGEGPWTIELCQGEWQSDDRIMPQATLYSGPVVPGTPVAVVLPADIPEGDDYCIGVYEGSHRALSGTFSISTTTLPGSDAAVPTAVELVEPGGGETWIQGLPAAIKWRIWPLHMPVWDHLMIALLREDGSAAKTYSLEANHRDLIFDNATREYTWVDFPRPDPGRYRVAVYALLPGDGAAGEVHLGIGADHGGGMTATSDDEGMTAVPLHPEWPSVLSDQGGLITIASEDHLEDAITLQEPRPEVMLHAGDLLHVRWDLDPVYERAVGTYPYTFSGMDIFLAHMHPDRGGVIAGREQVGPTERACDIRIPEDAAAGAYKVAIETIVENRTIPVFSGSQAVASAVQDITILATDGYFFLQPDRSEDYYQGDTLHLIWNAVGTAQEGDVDIELLDRSGSVLLYIGRYANRRPTQTRHTHDWAICGPGSGTMEDVRIRLSNISDRSIWAESVPLTIRPPDVTVVTPEGGTTWHGGDTVSVDWTSSPAPPAGAEYWIDICKGGICNQTIALVPAGAFGHSWVLSGDYEPGDDYTVRLCLSDCCRTVHLAESAAFTIR